MSHRKPHQSLSTGSPVSPGDINATNGLDLYLLLHLLSGHRFQSSRNAGFSLGSSSVDSVTATTSISTSVSAESPSSIGSGDYYRVVRLSVLESVAVLVSCPVLLLMLKDPAPAPPLSSYLNVSPTSSSVAFNSPSGSWTILPAAPSYTYAMWGWGCSFDEHWFGSFTFVTVMVTMISSSTLVSGCCCRDLGNHCIGGLHFIVQCLHRFDNCPSTINAKRRVGIGITGHSNESCKLMCCFQDPPLSMVRQNQYLETAFSAIERVAVSPSVNIGGSFTGLTVMVTVIGSDSCVPSEAVTITIYSA